MSEKSWKQIREELKMLPRQMCVTPVAEALECVDEILKLEEQLQSAQQEIERLREERDTLKELRLHRMEVENGKINFSISGEPGMAFAAILLRFFEDNGGKNFFSFDVKKDDMKFNITIRNLNGEQSPVEKLEQLSEQLRSAQQDKEKMIEGLHNYMKELDRRYQKAYRNYDIDCDHHQLGMAEAYEVAERRLRDILKEIGVTVE